MAEPLPFGFAHHPSIRSPTTPKAPRLQAQPVTSPRKLPSDPRLRSELPVRRPSTRDETPRPGSPPKPNGSAQKKPPAGVDVDVEAIAFLKDIFDGSDISDDAPSDNGASSLLTPVTPALPFHGANGSERPFEADLGELQAFVARTDLSHAPLPSALSSHQRLTTGRRVSPTPDGSPERSAQSWRGRQEQPALGLNIQGVYSGPSDHDRPAMSRQMSMNQEHISQLRAKLAGVRSLPTPESTPSVSPEVVQRPLGPAQSPPTGPSAASKAAWSSYKDGRNGFVPLPKGFAPIKPQATKPGPPSGPRPRPQVPASSSIPRNPSPLVPPLPPPAAPRAAEVPSQPRSCQPQPRNLWPLKGPPSGLFDASVASASAAVAAAGRRRSRSASVEYIGKGGGRSRSESLEYVPNPFSPPPPERPPVAGPAKGIVEPMTSKRSTLEATSTRSRSSSVDSMAPALPPEMLNHERQAPLKAGVDVERLKRLTSAGEERWTDPSPALPTQNKDPPVVAARIPSVSGRTQNAVSAAPSPPPAPSSTAASSAKPKAPPPRSFVGSGVISAVDAFAASMARLAARRAASAASTNTHSKSQEAVRPAPRADLVPPQVATPRLRSPPAVRPSSPARRQPLFKSTSPPPLGRPTPPPRALHHPRPAAAPAPNRPVETFASSSRGQMHPSRLAMIANSSNDTEAVTDEPEPTTENESKGIYRRQRPDELRSQLDSYQAFLDHPPVAQHQSRSDPSAVAPSGPGRKPSRATTPLGWGSPPPQDKTSSDWRPHEDPHERRRPATPPKRNASPDRYQTSSSSHRHEQRSEGSQRHRSRGEIDDSPPRRPTAFHAARRYQDEAFRTRSSAHQDQPGTRDGRSHGRRGAEIEGECCGHRRSEKERERQEREKERERELDREIEREREGEKERERERERRKEERSRPGDQNDRRQASWDEDGRRYVQDCTDTPPTEPRRHQSSVRQHHQHQGAAHQEAEAHAVQSRRFDRREEERHPREEDRHRGSKRHRSSSADYGAEESRHDERRNRRRAEADEETERRRPHKEPPTGPRNQDIDRYRPDDHYGGERPGPAPPAQGPQKDCVLIAGWFTDDPEYQPSQYELMETFFEPRDKSLHHLPQPDSVSAGGHQVLLRCKTAEDAAKLVALGPGSMQKAIFQDTRNRPLRWKTCNELEEDWRAVNHSAHNPWYGVEAPAPAKAKKKIRLEDIASSRVYRELPHPPPLGKIHGRRKRAGRSVASPSFEVRPSSTPQQPYQHSTAPRPQITSMTPQSTPQRHASPVGATTHLSSHKDFATSPSPCPSQNRQERVFEARNLSTNGTTMATLLPAEETLVKEEDEDIKPEQDSESGLFQFDLRAPYRRPPASRASNPASVSSAHHHSHDRTITASSMEEGEIRSAKKRKR